MKDAFYGKISQFQHSDIWDLHVEEIRNIGFTIVEGALLKSELNILRKKIDEVYNFQAREFGKNRLETIKEKNLCRFLVKYDEYFTKLIDNESINRIISRILGDFYIISLQNAIINNPNEEHHQRAWHRDLPYQNYIISTPLAINTLFCIDDFSSKTGGTMVLPYSHKMDILPSDEYIQKHGIIVNAKAGSVVVFDSMLFHRAGHNKSANKRRALNQMFTVPIMKQFYDFPQALGKKYADDERLSQILGYTSVVPVDDVEWRVKREKKFGVI